MSPSGKWGHDWRGGGGGGYNFYMEKKRKKNRINHLATKLETCRETFYGSEDSSLFKSCFLGVN